LGSAPVPGAGRCVSPRRTFRARRQRSFRRAAETNGETPAHRRVSRRPSERERMSQTPYNKSLIPIGVRRGEHRFGLRRHVAALKARTCPRTPNLIRLICGIRGCLNVNVLVSIRPAAAGFVVKGEVFAFVNAHRVRGCAVESDSSAGALAKEDVPSGESECAEDSARYNIRVHSCPFVVNIRRWLRLTTGE